MSRRDYIAIAGYLRDLKPTAGGYQLRRWCEFVSYLTIRCAQDNKAFDSVRFHNACTYGEQFDVEPLKAIVRNYHVGENGE
jgi:hypothetical protein